MRAVSGICTHPVHTRFRYIATSLAPGHLRLCRGNAVHEKRECLYQEGPLGPTVRWRNGQRPCPDSPTVKKQLPLACRK